MNTATAFIVKVMLDGFESTKSAMNTIAKSAHSMIMKLRSITGRCSRKKSPTNWPELRIEYDDANDCAANASARKSTPTKSDLILAGVKKVRYDVVILFIPLENKPA